MKQMDKTYVQYGCGLSAPNEWINFDTSPTLRIQKIPFIGRILKRKLHTVFPKGVLSGDIIMGLPGIKEQSCDGVYCSHVLEHLSLRDFRIALQNTYKILKKGGTFRCVLPDLEYAAKKYLEAIDANNPGANIEFLKSTSLGYMVRPRGIKAMIISVLGNSNHLFMWDRLSLYNELENAGFGNIRPCLFGDSKDQMFQLVEDKGRFENSLAFEAIK